MSEERSRRKREQRSEERSRRKREQRSEERRRQSTQVKRREAPPESLNEKLDRIKKKAIRFGKYVWTECKDWRTLVLFGIVLIVMYTPVWLGYFLYFIFRWKWCIGMATGYMLFWAGPVTPFFPLCIAITLAIKRVLWVRGMLPEPGNDKETRVTLFKKDTRKRKRKKDAWYRPILDLLKYLTSDNE